MIRFLLICCVFILVSCKGDKQKEATPLETSKTPTAFEKAVADPMTEFKGMTIDSRFNVPAGYTRTVVEENSFASYLRKLPLKTPGSPVSYYNGDTKPNEIHEAVLDLKIGDKDLHQCADAIIRLKAEHHWFQKEFDEITFNFTNGYKVDYNEWRKGKRMIVDGIKTYWDRKIYPSSDDYDTFWQYLELIFTYSGTQSLSNQLAIASIDELKIGDIFIKGGSPGHAVIVVDLATNKAGEKIFMLAQSFMPAQEIHILKSSSSHNPWYTTPQDGKLVTPEWTFSVKRTKEI